MGNINQSASENFLIKQYVCFGLPVVALSAKLLKLSNNEHGLVFLYLYMCKHANSYKTDKSSRDIEHFVAQQYDSLGQKINIKCLLRKVLAMCHVKLAKTGEIVRERLKFCTIFFCLF